jgi:hypothetical protein
VTIQNKVAADRARELQRMLEFKFSARAGAVTGAAHLGISRWSMEAERSYSVRKKCLSEATRKSPRLPKGEQYQFGCNFFNKSNH